MNKDKINIVAIPNDSYVQHLAVTLQSLYSNTKSISDINMYILDSGISNENKNRLKSLASKFNTEFIFVPIESDVLKYEDVPLSGHITKEAYYRIAIPEIFASYSIHKVIYLDCDLLVLDDIEKMWNINIDEKALGAVVDLGGEDRIIDLNIPDKSLYFNSGILIFNMDKWVEENISGKIMNYIKKNSDKLLLHDQDALNGVLYKDWYEISPHWNFQTSMLDYNILDDLKTKFDISKSNLGIVHFTGAIKPWHFNSLHPYKKLYFNYLSKTEWKDFKPEINLQLIIKKYAVKFLPKKMVELIRKNIS